MKHDLFSFDKMITPKIISIIYYLLLAGSVIYGVIIMFTYFSFKSFCLGLLAMVFGALFSRIWCELLIVTFKINENLKKIADKE